MVTQINIDVGPLLAMGFTGATVEGGTYERRRRNIQTFYEGPEDRPKRQQDEARKVPGGPDQEQWRSGASVPQ